VERVVIVQQQPAVFAHKEGRDGIGAISGERVRHDASHCVKLLTPRPAAEYAGMRQGPEAFIDDIEDHASLCSAMIRPKTCETAWCSAVQVHDKAQRLSRSKNV
jgi:hypothetical protein